MTLTILALARLEPDCAASLWLAKSRVSVGGNLNISLNLLPTSSSPSLLLHVRVQTEILQCAFRKLTTTPITSLSPSRSRVSPIAASICCMQLANVFKSLQDILQSRATCRRGILLMHPWIGTPICRPSGSACPPILVALPA